MISPEQKRKLKNFLGEELVDTVERNDLRQVKKAVSEINDGVSKSLESGLRSLEKKISRIQNTDLTPVIEAFNKFADIVVKTHKPQDLSGFFNDLGVQLSKYGSSSKNTEELIRNLKWNSWMGIKDTNGSPLNPATDGSSKIGTGIVTIATAGTAVQLPSNACKKVIIQSKQDNGSLTNSGVVIIGSSNVLYSSHNGFELFPTQSQVFDVTNTNMIWVDSSDDTAKVQYLFEAVGNV